MDSGFHRSRPHSRSSGNLVHREILQETQRDHDPVVGTQGPDCPPERINLAGSIIWVRQRLRRQVDDPAVRRGVVPQAVPALVDDDAIEPAVEPVLIAQAGPAQPCLNCGVVDRVLRFRASVEDSGCKAIGAVKPLVGQPPENRRLGSPKRST